MNQRVFIIDDEIDMINIATKLLEVQHFTVKSDTNPISALPKIQQDPPDLILLDINMREMNGLQVCRELKANPKTSHIPVIMISVNAEEADVVVGLEMGAEDYVRKPFMTRELVARVNVVLRRQGKSTQPTVLTMGPFEVDFGAYRVTMDGAPLSLSPKEFELLGYFIRNEGRVLTRTAMYEAIWGVDLKGQSRTVDSHVDTLRKKLGANREMIQGLKGIGYRFEISE